jgi:hypothetical protein
MDDKEKKIIEESSVPLSGGGDTHIHPYGKKKKDFVITTRIPVGEGNVVEIHDEPDESK